MNARRSKSNQDYRCLRTCLLIVATAMFNVAGCSQSETDSNLATDVSFDGDIDAYVNEVFFEGVPYTQTRELFNEQDAYLLHSILDDPERVDDWSNSAIILTMIGDVEDIPTVIAFVERFDEFSEPDDATLAYDAKLYATMCSGYLLNRTDDPVLFEFLVQLAAPRSVFDSGERAYPEYADTMDKQRELEKMAMMALALSGNEGGRGALEFAKESPAFPLAEEDLELIDELIEVNRIVNDVGLDGYYSDYGEYQ